MKKLWPLFLMMSFAGCDLLRQGQFGTSRTNVTPMTTVIDGQSNGENLGITFLRSAMVKAGFPNMSVQNISVGGTYLREHMIGGRLHQRLIDTLSTTQPALYVWWQGEAEASYGTGSFTYGEDLTAFFRDLQRQFPATTIVYVKLSIQIWTSSHGTDPAWKRTRKGQDDLFLPNVFSVNIDDMAPYPLGEEGAVHFIGDQYTIVAERITAAYQNRASD